MRLGFKTKIYCLINHLIAAKFKQKNLNDLDYESHIFLDCGANNGCSVRKFRQEIDKEEKYQIFSFEPNPAFKNSFQDFHKHIFIPKAVWITDGKLNFFDSMQEDKYGGTVIEHKTTGQVNYNQFLEVESIDFPTWINSNFSEKDFVILKLDIEGAEYTVLEKMIKNGSIKKINLFFVEWHFNKIQIDKKIHKKIMRTLKSINLIPYDWHAADYI